MGPKLERSSPAAIRDPPHEPHFIVVMNSVAALDRRSVPSPMFRSIAAVGLTRAGAVLLDATAYVLVARFLGPVDYGFYVSFMAFAVLLDFAADMTLVDIAVREMAKDDAGTNTWLVSASVLRSVLSAAGVVAFATYMYFVGSAYPPGVIASGWFAVLIMPTGALRMPLAAFRAKLRLDYELAVTLISRTVNLIVIVWLINQGAALAAFILAAVAARALLGILSWMIGWAPLGFSLRWRYFDMGVFRTLVRESIPMGISGLFVAVQLRGDILVVSQMVGARAAGIYGVVANLPEYFLLIPVVITTPVLPVLSRLFKDAERRQFQQLYQTVFDVLMTGIVPAFVVALLMPTNIVTWLFGAQYAEAASVLPFLAASIVFIWFSHVTAIAAVATGLQGCFIWIQSCCVTAFVLLSLVLIPTWGIIGAGTARVVGTVIAPLLTYGVVAKRAGFTLNGRAVSRVLFCGLLMGLAVVLVARIDHSLALFCGVMVYIGALLMVGPPDWRILRERESGAHGA